jgi:hypothetical protein
VNRFSDVFIVYRHRMRTCEGPASQINLECTLCKLMVILKSK